MSKKGKLLIGFVVIIVVGVFIYFNLQESKGKEIEVTSKKVKKETITSTVTGTGRIQPETEVKMSAYVTGEIVELAVKEGDHVTKGQFLCQLDRTRYEAALKQSQALLKSGEANTRLSKANLEKTEKELARTKKLFDRKLISESEYEQLKANYEVAKATNEANLDMVSQRKASVDEAQDNLDKTRLESPMDGTVSQLNSEEGEVVLGTGYASGTVVMTVADLNKMEVLSEIDENDIVNVELGDEVDIEIDAFPDTTFRGIVSEISNTAITIGRGTQEEVTNFSVKIAVMDKIPSLRPGMSSTVEIQTETHENIVTVPIQCITTRKPKGEDKDKDADTTDTEDDNIAATNGEVEDTKADEIEVVFIIRDGKAYQQPVKTDISDDTKIEVIEGLSEGDEIVTGSFRVLSKTLKDGDLVKTRKPKSRSGSQKNEE